jgi:hypothetical protein
VGDFFPTEHVTQPKRRRADNNTSRQNEQQIARHFGRLTISNLIFQTSHSSAGPGPESGIIMGRFATQPWPLETVGRSGLWLPGVYGDNRVFAKSDGVGSWPLTTRQTQLSRQYQLANSRSLKRLLGLQRCIASPRTPADLSALHAMEMEKTSRRGMTAGRRASALLANRLLQLSRRDPASSLHRFRLSDWVFNRGRR